MSDSTASFRPIESQVSFPSWRNEFSRDGTIRTRSSARSPSEPRIIVTSLRWTSLRNRSAALWAPRCVDDQGHRAPILGHALSYRPTSAGTPIDRDADGEGIGPVWSNQHSRIRSDKFNEACRANVLKYTAEWERVVGRLGRWVDFENDYKTMDLTFMESIWWVFGQLWEKGLIYEDFRVMPFSWRLSTSLFPTSRPISTIETFRIQRSQCHWPMT